MQRERALPCIIACCDWTDVAVAECHVAAMGCAPPGTPFIAVAAFRFSVVNCAFLVRLMAEGAPRGSVLIGCCDPRLPGIDRIPLGMHFKERDLFFVGPNSGTASLLLDSFEATTVVRLDSDRWGRDQFLGRALFAPTAGRVIAKQPLQELGQPFPVESVTRVRIPKFTVLHIDNFGNIKLNCTSDDLPPLAGSKFSVNGHPATLSVDFKKADGELIQEDELILASGSSLDLLEIQKKAARPSSRGAAEFLQVEIGDGVVITGLT